MLPSMWKVMRIANGKIAKIGTADFAAAPGTQLTIEGRQYEVLSHERTADDGWVYVTLVSSPRI
jgi:hypothetical protein